MKLGKLANRCNAWLLNHAAMEMTAVPKQFYLHSTFIIMPVVTFVQSTDMLYILFVAFSICVKKLPFIKVSDASCIDQRRIVKWTKTRTESHSLNSHIIHTKILMVQLQTTIVCCVLGSPSNLPFPSVSRSLPLLEN